MRFTVDYHAPIVQGRGLYFFKEESGRPHRPQQVYSGGGIEPDKRFDGPLEGFNPTRFGRTLYGRGFFQSYAEQFSAEGDTRDWRTRAANA